MEIVNYANKATIMKHQKLNILHINKFHYPFGGAEVVYLDTADVLEKHGHKTLFFSMQHPYNLFCKYFSYFIPYMDLNNVKGLLNQFKAFFRIFYSYETNKLLSRLLEEYPIDIAHLHNIHHHITPSILYELKRRKIPVVMTLHAYRMVCASYFMFFKGKVCEACYRGKYYKAIKNRCFMNSKIKSALVTFEMYLHNKVLDIYKHVDVFISPSLFLKNKLEEMGFKKEIVYLPNFVDIKKFANCEEDNKNTKENSIVYFGRLSPEKGLWTLLEGAKLLKNGNKKLEIKIIGDGTIRKELEEKVKTERIDNVKFLGYMKGEALYKEVKKSMAAVIPSEWYENNPMSVLEAFALGKPIIGSNIGGIPELVIDGITGYTFEPSNAEDLKSKIAFLIKDKDALYTMGRNARELVERKFNSEVYYENLMSIYENVLNNYG